MNGEREHEEVQARRFDWGLREVVGDETPPDVTAAVLARAAAGEVVDRGVLPVASPPARRLLVAALMLLGLGAVLGVLLLERRGGSPAPEAPLSAAQEPAWVEVSDARAIAGLARDLAAVSLRNLDDAAVTALVARCPDLQCLRLFASTAYRRQDDPREPVSITDAAFDGIARLSELRRLELIGTDAVAGAGLRRLDALPMLETLVLSYFDTGDDALAVLPRLPSLRVLDLSGNHGFREHGIRAIADCPGLQRLSLSTFVLRSDWLGALARLTGLVELELDGGFRGTATPELGQRHRAAIDARFAEVDRIGAGLRGDGLPGWPKLRRLEARSHARLEADVGRALRESCPQLREVDLSGCALVDDTTVAELLGLTHLQALDLSDCANVSALSLPLLQSARQLRDIGLDKASWMTLDLAGQLIRSGRRLRCRLDDGTQAGDGMSAADFNAGVAALMRRHADVLGRPVVEFVHRPEDFAGLPDDARAVTVEGRFTVTAADFRRLERLADLEELACSGVAGIDADGLARLAALPRLRSLAFSDVPSVPQAAEAMLAPLSAFVALEELRIFRGGRLDARSLAAVVACRRLRTLELSGCGDLADDLVAAIGRMRRLEVLRLVNVGMLRTPGLQGLAALTGLRELALWGGRISAEGLQALAGMRDLRTLMLCDNPLLDAAAMRNVPPWIEELGLDDCSGLDIDAVRQLRAHLPGLRRLYLSENAWVDDEVLAEALQLPQLEELQIRLCGGTSAASIPAIVAAPRLRKLVVWGCSWMNDDLAAGLKARRPDLDVLR